MRNIKIWAAVWILAACVLSGFAQTQADEKLFSEAKVLIFDKNWDAARARLDELLGTYPKSPFFAQASFYKARCLAEEKGHEREALSAFKAYLAMDEKSSSLDEEAEISVIDLSNTLGQAGDRSAVREIESRLGHPNKNVRYYAAFTLSYAGDKAVAARGIPILKSIIETEGSGELKDRARIALLRISPDALQGTESRRPMSQPRLLRIQVVENGRTTVDINIPWALASLALEAMPEAEKAKMRAKGYDLDRVLTELAKSKSSILEINDEGSRVRIWIE
jgi:hypothetical protein